MKPVIVAIFNPTAVGIAVMHWIVVLFAIFGEDHTHPFHFYYEPLLTQFLVIINTPALSLAMFIAWPVVYVLGMQGWAADMVLYISWFITGSLQWLLIGWIPAQFWNPWTKRKNVLTIRCNSSVQREP